MNAPVTYTPRFLRVSTIPSINTMWSDLWNGLDWKTVTARRREYWTNALDRPYTYGSGTGARTYESQPSHSAIDWISDFMCLAGYVNFLYEGCFLNGYETGKNALSWHCDDDPGIDHSRPIAIVTLYDGEVCPVEQVDLKNGGKTFKPIKDGVPGQRVIQFKPKEGGDVESLSLANGSLVLLHAGMQQTHFHQIPTAAGYNTRPRISLTYRSLLR